MNTSHLQIIQSCQESLISLEKMSPIGPKLNRINELDSKINAPDLWTNPQLAANLMKERKQISEFIDVISQAKDYTDIYMDVIRSGELGSEDFAHLFLLSSNLQELVFKEMMNDPIDNAAAILSISAGAGGLESANFVTMLLRMYVRYADSQRFLIEILDQKPSEEHSSICLDSVSIRIEGPYAYGFFKGESGVHRLIRNSPFNSANARETSFAAVSVTADIEDIIDIKIEDKDIDIIAIARGGSGGQNQNKVASAIRLRHFPTGINILIKTERDFHKNKATAFKILKSKLYELEMQKKKDAQDGRLAQQMTNAFGSQIKTYTMSPYSLVKDHRTGYEINDTDSVLDGDIKGFMIAYLQSNY